MDERHNAPLIHTREDEYEFQKEIRGLYESLRCDLGKMGEEGDYYGISDFAIRPDLRDRATVNAAAAPHVREFLLIILKKSFYRKGFLEILRQFLLSEAIRYRIQISQDFDAKWTLHLFLTVDSAQLYCTDAHEFAKLREQLLKL